MIPTRVPLSWSVACAAVALACAATVACAADADSPVLAAPLPKPLFKTHFNSGAGKYVFKNRASDLALISTAFNAVIVDYGNQDVVDAARAAGLAVIVEFDKKADFAAGKDIGAVTSTIIRQVRAHPGTIAGIRVADRVNEKLPPTQAIAYLAATGGVFHHELPGMPVIVDVEDWELTCGQPGQSSCEAHRSDAYQWCTDAVLQKIQASGYVDAFELASNLKDDDEDAELRAMKHARKLFPAPFLLYSRSAELSFKDDTYPGDEHEARRQIDAFIEAPLKAGLDGIDLWAWHRPWKTELRTFLNKDGSTNPLWDGIVKAYTASVSAR